VLPGSPAEFGKHIAAETEKWAKVIEFAGIKAECDADSVIAFTIACCCTSCDNASSADEGPQPQLLGA
jgi:hypothetical protein